MAVQVHGNDVTVSDVDGIGESVREMFKSNQAKEVYDWSREFVPETGLDAEIDESQGSMLDPAAVQVHYELPSYVKPEQPVVASSDTIWMHFVNNGNVRVVYERQIADSSDSIRETTDLQNVVMKVVDNSLNDLDGKILHDCEIKYGSGKSAGFKLTAVFQRDKYDEVAATIKQVDKLVAAYLGVR